MSGEGIKFKELEQLCAQPGFLHAFSYFCRRDCTVGFVEGLKNEDLMHLYGPDRLIKTELSTLHGLILKSGYYSTQVKLDEIARLVSDAERLLSEIHDELKKPAYERFSPENMKLSMEEFFAHPDMIRESVFYSAEQAFDFQFAELAVQRYREDAAWLQSNAGFDLEEGYLIYRAINNVLNENVQAQVDKGERGSEIKSYLDMYEIDLDKLVTLSKLTEAKVISFLEAFSTHSSEGNSQFNSIDDFNVVNAKPIVKLDKRYYVFQLTSLAQSLYESPIFWMRGDKSYIDSAVEHRGGFTEEFAYERLVSVFGRENVFVNVDIFKNASEKVGEIDILAKFGSRYLVIQAKSKGMTIPSRKGQVELVKSDFAKGVQNAYDQAIDCATALKDENVVFKDIDGNEIVLADKPTVCYPICLTSESYPSLMFQCRQYLKYEQREDLNPPFIMDVFFLDILTEFLNQPLFLLSYIDRRSSYTDSVMASTEIVLLSMHLKRNLWLDENKFDFMHLEDDIASDLDAAFMVRRLGIPGQRTPQGILQRYSKGFIGKLIFKIQRIAIDELIGFGFTLLKASGNFLDTLDSAVSKLCYLATQDGKLHDFSVLFDKEEGGLTVHTLCGELEQRQEKLLSHINAKKYAEKQDSWTGIIVDPRSGMVSEMCHVNHPWKQDDEMDEAIRLLGLDTRKIKPDELKAKLKFKLGRNDKCPCGSGKKYKKCCLE
ncbi:SEC-C domain-containing protein [Vibrio parahaemolyticus]|nr:SEC-C domain-containing protein [Vibrio parahaemolyticus]